MTPPTEPERDPPRRALLVALVFVALLAAGGVFVVKKMIDLATLQDCAATGRQDC